MKNISNSIIVILHNRSRRLPAQAGCPDAVPDQTGESRKGMDIRITDDFNLGKIAESGQCFRWKKTDGATWRIIAGDRCLHASVLGGGRYRFDCTENAFQECWARYFDLDENYQKIRERVSPAGDPFLRAACEQGKGIRILRQDPWETLITFIISQNRNIPAIRRSVELLSSMCGSRLYDSMNTEYHAFPTPEQLSSLTVTQLTECRLGYRWKYVHAAAETIQQGKFCLEEIRHRNCEETIRELTSLYGIGEKVANCIALFGFHQLDAFPRDVWINRVLANEYPDGYPFEQYSPYNGVYQQYMFAYYRSSGRQLTGV